MIFKFNEGDKFNNIKNPKFMSDLHNDHTDPDHQIRDPCFGKPFNASGQPENGLVPDGAFMKNKERQLQQAKIDNQKQKDMQWSEDKPAKQEFTGGAHTLNHL